jgi:hypothetical protein
MQEIYHKAGSFLGNFVGGLIPKGEKAYHGGNPYAVKFNPAMRDFTYKGADGVDYAIPDNLRTPKTSLQSAAARAAEAKEGKLAAEAKDFNAKRLEQQERQLALTFGAERDKTNAIIAGQQSALQASTIASQNQLQAGLAGITAGQEASRNQFQLGMKGLEQQMEDNRASRELEREQQRSETALGYASLNNQADAWKDQNQVAREKIAMEADQFRKQYLADNFENHQRRQLSFRQGLINTGAQLLASARS